MSWKDLFGGVVVAFVTLFLACFAIIVAVLAVSGAYDWISAGVVPTGETLSSRLRDTAAASALLAVFWALYGAVAALFDPEESPLRRRRRASRVRSPWGKLLATMAARNSRPKCALGFVFFVLVAALGLLIVSTAQAPFYVVDGWLCLLAGALLSSISPL